MDFIVFNLLLLAASFPALLIFAVGMVILSPLSSILSDRSTKAIVFPRTAMAGTLVGFLRWIYKYTLRPEVTWDGVYFVFGFG